MKNLINRLARLNKIVVKLYEEEGVLSVGGVYNVVHLDYPKFMELFAHDGFDIEEIEDENDPYVRLSMKRNGTKFICVVKKEV